MDGATREAEKFRHDRAPFAVPLGPAAPRPIQIVANP